MEKNNKWSFHSAGDRDWVYYQWFSI